MIPVLFGQLPFLAGEAVGLVALVCAQGRHRRLALLIAPCCALLSPVAGALLVVVLIARAIASPADHRVQAALLTGVAAAPMVLVERMFPVSGTSPFWGGDLALVLGLAVEAPLQLLGEVGVEPRAHDVVGVEEVIEKQEPRHGGRR